MAKQSSPQALSSYVKVVFNQMVTSYQNILKQQALSGSSSNNSKKKIAFPERNLTFNFCSSYLQQSGKFNGDEIFVWQELDVNYNSCGGHIDSMICDMRSGYNSIIFIEAKRFAPGGQTVNGKKVSKCEALKNDVKRISDIIESIISDSSSCPLPECVTQHIRKNLNNMNIYILVLVDYWEWNGNKNNIATECKNGFEKCSGNSFVQINSSPLNKGIYYLNYCLKPLPLSIPCTARKTTNKCK